VWEDEAGAAAPIVMRASGRGVHRAAARRAAGRLLDCARLEQGFARARCGACRAEFLVAFCFHGR
jgi:hypothetical protein